MKIISGGDHLVKDYLTEEELELDVEELQQEE